MKPETAISVQALSKQYRRGPDRPLTFSQVLARAFPSVLGRGGPGNRRRLGDTQRNDLFWALQDVTFDVRRGERVGIIGRNGAGKSTLLKILSRIVSPTEGEAWIFGRVTSLLEVGTGFNPNLSGGENIYLNASIYGLQRREIDARFDDIVEFSGLRDFVDTPVRHYSSGMFMRLAFSVAAHLDPDILLLDEVLAVGDLSFQQKCLQRVEGLTSEGRTVLFVSHSLDAVTRLCDRAIWLDQGRVARDGPAVEVVEAYVEDVMGLRSSQAWGDADAVVAEDGQSGARQEHPRPATATVGGLAGEGEGRDMAQPEPESASRRSLSETDSSVPGNEWTRLVSARVIQSAGETISSAPVDESIGIEVVYDILKPGKIIQPGLHFKTPQGTYAFVVAYTDSQYMTRVSTPGRYVMRAWIPANFMNEGVMYVSVALNTPDPMERHCQVDGAVSFTVYERDGGKGTARGLYSRLFPGVVRPKLRWETRYLGDPARLGVAVPRG